MSTPAQSSSPSPDRATWHLPQLEHWIIVPLIVVLAIGAIGFGGMFAVYTYVAPIVTDVAGTGPLRVVRQVLGGGHEEGGHP